MPKKSTDITFRLENICIQKFYIDQTVCNEPDEFTIGVSVSFDFKPEGNTIDLTLSTTVTPRESKTQTHISELITRYRYTIEDPVVAEADDIRIKLPKDFLTTLVAISYSTQRGLLYDRVATSPLEKLILPLINPSELLENSSKTGV